MGYSIRFISTNEMVSHTFATSENQIDTRKFTESIVYDLSSVFIGSRRLAVSIRFDSSVVDDGSVTFTASRALFSLIANEEFGFGRSHSFSGTAPSHSASYHRQSTHFFSLSFSFRDSGSFEIFIVLPDSHQFSVGSHRGVTLSAGALLGVIIASIVVLCGLGLLILIVIKRHPNEYDEYEEDIQEYALDDISPDPTDRSWSDMVGFSFENVLSDEGRYGSMECEETNFRW
jgi:hypothetical protein